MQIVTALVISVSEVERFVMALWESQSVQFVWFLPDVTNVRADQIYLLVTGDEAEIVQRNKVPGPANPLLGLASGTRGARAYQVQLQPGRLDVVVSPAETQDLDDAMPLMDTAAILADIESRAGEVSAAVGPAVRLSVVANLIKPEVDEQAATRAFLDVTEYELGYSDVRDPILQVNRRKALQDVDVQINRVMRFGVAATQHFVFQMIPQVGMHSGATPISKQSFGTSLTLDFNTVPTGRLIEAVEQGIIFRQLIAETLRVGASVSPKALGD
ncbi:hypothetical protein REJC140_00088 [Pseudorhizobium endolithicum]|uniref:Uncharacterized protein n=1 Tax=Pseudorhizobium endolithicum TaxID=1191678 RepID=A0ABM8PCF7_9HYPH|nr:hypothetical protein [Pseudorhizobium endolithicum]CAD7023085.1 hypothetical protein REJC140_00088 [Pseudorhizobium endolithicum]